MELSSPSTSSTTSAPSAPFPSLIPDVPSPLMQNIGNLWRFLMQNPKVAFGFCIVLFFVLIAIFGPIFVPGDPNELGRDTLESPSARHWLGTTQTGQDIFEQAIVGTRSSLVLGLITGTITTLISVVVGLLSGYYGGWLDEIFSLLSNVFLVLPAIPLAIVLGTFLPYKGPWIIGLVIVVTGWSWGARVLRAQTLSLRDREMVEAARACGESSFHIIFFEILPNMIALVAAGLLSTIVYAILAETGLEFLGLGDLNAVSWGTMFYWAANNDALLLGAWWWFLAPGLCVALLGAGLAFINFGIDEIANPRLRKEPVPKKLTQRKGASSPS